MNYNFEFKCEKCGYYTTLTGPIRHNEDWAYAPMICRDCKELVLVLGCTTPFYSEPYKPPEAEHCPKCNSSNVEYMDEDQYPCPKCGVNLMFQQLNY
ncbi:MAG: hypothetical protein E3J72_10335 [Planctomycetota bacterium]|nr:MAG: hypothetical protein E3J72_10335 [Planctomycetota bacterium]